MTTPQHRRGATRRLVTATLLALTLSACASKLSDLRPEQGATTQSFQGNYEAIAACVADAGERAAGGAPLLKVDRASKSASVRRLVPPATAPVYEFRFVQTGVNTVTVSGSGSSTTDDGTRSFAFLWTQVDICATNQMAP